MGDTIRREHVVADIRKIGKRTWEGVLVDNRTAKQDERTVVWRCGHEHSKPEFNVRTNDGDGIWETSARYCARDARLQMTMEQDSETIRSPYRGLIDYEKYVRQDYKKTRIGTTNYRGVLMLVNDQRRLYLSTSTIIYGDGPYRVEGLPWIDLDRPRSNEGTGFSDSDYRTNETRELLMAAAVFKEDAWGVVFRHPRDLPEHPSPVQEMIDQFIPVKRTKTPYIRAVRQGRKREFEVLDHRGKVVITTPHRGKAVRELEKLEPMT